MSLPPPFPPKTPSAGFVPNGDLHKKLNAGLAASKFKDAFRTMSVAVADLTAIAEDPSTASSFAVPFGANALMDMERAIGSLAKIATLCAAFRLREQVAAAAAAVGGNAKTADEVAAQIEAAWKTTVSTRISKPPQDFPKLTNIFAFGTSPPWNPKFTDDGKDLKALAPFHDQGKDIIDKLGFLDRLKLMIRFSDNMAAGSCVRAIGFQYTNGSLAADGFADNKQNGVLWNGGDIGHTKTPPIMGHPPWAREKNATWVRANARGIASYLTLVWTNQLVSKIASGEMRKILLDQSVGLGTHLANGTPERLRSFGKTGVLPGNFSEGIIVECKGRSGRIRYAAVGLGATRSELMTELGVVCYEAVKALH